MKINTLCLRKIKEYFNSVTMKPGSSAGSTSVTSASEPQENEKNIRMSLHVLQPAAGNKENLVGAGRMPKVNGGKGAKDIVEQLKGEKLEQHSLKSKPKKKVLAHKSVQTESGDVEIILKDLTSEDGPSEHYWERVAETRRIALEKTLEENRKLHEKIELLEQENALQKEVLEEAQTMVQVLNEMLGEGTTETDVPTTASASEQD